MKTKLKFPSLAIVKRKKVRASAGRRSVRAATAEYDDMAEPNMKLSRALLIVLVLHVVAVSGIIAFNAIKTRQARLPAPAAVVSRSANETDSSKKSETSVSPSPTKEAGHDESKASHSPPRPFPKAERAKPVSSLDSGKVYVVAKGDTPVSIAKKLKVSYDELLELNHIEDPHKLKIGQKLAIPNKIPKAKKVDE